MCQEHSNREPYFDRHIALERLPRECEAVEHPRKTADDCGRERQTDVAEQDEHSHAREEQMCHQEYVMDPRRRDRVRERNARWIQRTTLAVGEKRCATDTIWVPKWKVVRAK